MLFLHAWERSYGLRWSVNPHSSFSPGKRNKGHMQSIHCFWGWKQEDGFQLQKWYTVVSSLRACAKSPEHWPDTHPFYHQPTCAGLFIEKNYSSSCRLWPLVLLKGKGNSLRVDLVLPGEALRADYGKTAGLPKELGPTAEEGNSPSSKRHTRPDLWILLKVTSWAVLWSRICRKKI